MAFQMREIRGHKNWMKRINNHSFSTEEAIEDWHQRGLDVQFRKKYNAQATKIMELCYETCGGIKFCKGIDQCPLEYKLTHEVLA